jgi:hypothetical protein
MKTFVLVVYLLTSGGDVERYHAESGLNAETCASYLTASTIVGAPAPKKSFKSGRRVEKIVVACEEEQAA